jgi:hypothetical protein
MKPAAAMMRRLPQLFLIERDATPWKRQNSDYQEIFIGPYRATRIAESSIEDARAANHVT